MKKIRSFK